ncbi:uncharacterized protein BX663DRAFT_449044 [Cokeromyces recurvatus]|uniref:uncharacterized protein n=1 Tax=Cokeromyces recurvatus TaxID=90255 RepID=UPI00221FE167|nr:uncharacterized protein BX663DRAFT_449044 [Cokeromyces recurvatus]KAI7906035.1 hypothetical protein BX663DRAFT_449044 [Cokeromyces recurvatus]
MQVSINNLDAKVDNNNQIFLQPQETKVNENNNVVPSQLNGLASDDSYNYLTIPYVLNIQQEDNLSIDIIKLYQELLPTKESHDRRVKFVDLMERLLNNEWPDHDIKANVFGSSVNDLGTSTSDVDLCITTPWNGLRNIRILAKLFRRCGMQHVVCVPRAKVPIVRLFDPELQLSCDINVNNTLALQNTKMIKTYVALDPRVRPLMMTIKHWTKQRVLNDAANGGTLSSYTWTCMIINFLQQREPPILPVLHLIENENKKDDYFYDDVDKLKGFGSKNHESLGGLMFAFFRRFAIEFDYNTQVVSVRQGRYLTKQEKGWDTGRNKFSLCVEEPFNVSRNLGNSADITSVRGLRNEFQRFLDLLLAGESLATILTPYQPLLFNKTINPNSSFTTATSEIPSNNNSNNVLSLTLPNDTRNSSLFLPLHPFSNYNNLSMAAAHPYDRRRSMVDGIYSYPSSMLSDSYSTLNPHHIHPLHNISSSNTFHPRFSSPQVLDSILKGRNSRHGSHPLSPVPSTLLSMLNIKANYGTDQSVDKIFARYHKTRSSPQPSETKSYNKRTQNGYRYNKGGLNHHHEQQRKPKHRLSTAEWPTISTSTSTPNSSSDSVKLLTLDKNSKASYSAEQPQRSRRWSTIKKPQLPEQTPTTTATTTTVTPEVSKKRTLAEIVKIHTPSSPPPPPPSSSSSSAPPPRTVSTSTSMTSNKSRNNRKLKNNTNNGSHKPSNNRRKKKPSSKSNT